MYGLILSIAIISCLFVAEYLARLNNKNTQTISDISFISIICGLIGARLYHVIDFFEFYKEFPLKILDLRTGGLGIYGAIFGGFIGEFAYLHYKKLDSLFWLNLSACVLPLGQAIGRFGNYFNKELYGTPTSLPWAITVNNTQVHPLFLYESILNLILFGYLYLSFNKNKHTFLLYLQGYAWIRLILEPFRITAWEIYNLNVAQMISILIILTTYVFIYRLRSRRI